jgi:hypothetical protein
MLQTLFFNSATFIEQALQQQVTVDVQHEKQLKQQEDARDKWAMSVVENIIGNDILRTNECEWF